MPRKPTKARWTPEDLAILRDGYARARSLRTIARQLGRSLTACAGQAHRLGLRQPGRTYSRRDATDTDHTDHVPVPAPSLVPGLTLRAYVATQCLQGLLACRTPSVGDDKLVVHYALQAVWACRAADALLAGLAEPQDATRSTPI